MPTVRIRVEWEGISAMEARIDSIGQKTVQNIEKNMHNLGEDAHVVMQEHTHVRSGRLLEGDQLNVAGMSFELANQVRYAKFIEGGHMTPSYFHTRHGIRPAKKRSFVGPFPFLEPAVEFGMENILEYLSHSLAD